MKIALLHTAEVHVTTFDRLFRQLAPGTRCTHVVAEDLLTRARAHGLDAARPDTVAALDGLKHSDAVLCTCSTLGPIAEAQGVVRVDRPLMEAACALGPNVLVALCLESTKAPTLDLLHETARAKGTQVTPEVLLLSDLWPLFEAGQHTRFIDKIATAVAERLEDGGIDCVVLAQASMAEAATRLSGHPTPVLASPELAARAAIAKARVANPVA